jgi:hypothetical protein
MTSCRLSISFLLLFVWQASIFGQSSKVLTDSESREVKEFAHKFYDRLNETKDIAQLTKKFFRKDFIERSLLTGYANWGFMFPNSLAKRTPVSMLRRYFIAETNYFYIGRLWLKSKGESLDKFKDADVGEFIKIYPRDMRRVMENDRLFQKVLHGDNFGEDDSLRSDPKVFRHMLHLYEKLAPLIRAHAAKLSPKKWRSLLDAEENASGNDYFKPWLLGCDANGDCKGLPPYSKKFAVIIPGPIQLNIVETNGNLRVLWTSWYED